ncbi:MAG: DNA-formamidopyrimidine glycosylase, partial [candidate division Zixibacteria bacterium RBG_16_40_9]
GKNILISLSNGKTWLTHLGMTGHLFFYSNNNLTAEKHDVLKIKFKNNSGELRFEDMRKFGRTYIVEDHPQKPIEKLGPEPLKVSFKQFEKIFSSRKRKMKPALLDQSLIAGIGNIYADESLFEAKIHPETRTDRLSQKKLSALYQAIRKIIKRAIETGGSSVRSYVDVEGRKGYFQIFHKVYGKEGERCPRCKTKIKRIVVGQRSSHFCPKCQRKSMN